MPGFGEFDINFTAYLAPSGSIVYSDIEGAAGSHIRKFVPDAFEYDQTKKIWGYPQSPKTNDPEVVPRTKCASTLLSGIRGTEWVMQGGTGAILYDCIVNSIDNWYDAAGTLRISGVKLRAWNASNYLFGQSDSSSQWVVFSPAGAIVPITGIDTTVDLPVFVRSHGAGFYLLTVVDVTVLKTGVYKRFVVDDSGAATLEGTFARLPSGYTSYATPVFDNPVLDAAGDLYSFGTDTASYGVVVHRPLLPGTATVLYDENLPANDPTADRFYTRLMGHGTSSRLITGP